MTLITLSRRKHRELRTLRTLRTLRALVISSVAAFSLIAAGCTVNSDRPSLAGQDVRLTVIHTADLHSRLFPYQFAPGAIDKGLGLIPTKGDIATVGGIARIATVINCIRGTGGNLCDYKRADGHSLNDYVGGSAGRTIHLDSGDIFEGAPVFNTFNGEVEMRAVTKLGLNAMALGNHEFDKGALNLELMKQKFGGFPILAANYEFSDPNDPTQPKLRKIIAPFAIFNTQGLRIGVIGMGNLSSLQGVVEGGNSLGIVPIETTSAVKNAVNFLRGQVDLVVMISHLGLDEDEGVAQTTNVMDQNPVIDGVDVTLGGHLHIVLNPPKDIPRYDEKKNPTGHTVLCHSGAFAKFVGRLDLAVHIADPSLNAVTCGATTDPGDAGAGDGGVQVATDCSDACACKDASGHVSEKTDCAGYQQCVASGMKPSVHIDRNGVKSYTYKLIPIDDSIPEDADMANMLEPYQLRMNTVLNLTHNYSVIPCPSTSSTCPKVQRNDPNGGDSQLGNLVAASMRLRPRVEADFGLTNSLGIRADFESGPLNLEEMYNVFPFDNTITTMFLSGNEIQQMFDFIAARSAERGCKTQTQVSGIWVTLDCGARRQVIDPVTKQPVIDPNTMRPVTEPFAIACGPIDAMGMPATGCHPDHRELDGPYLLGDKCIVNGMFNKEAACNPVLPAGEYRVAVNDYIANGGSGFAVLKRNTTKFNTGISLRDSLIDFIVEQNNRCDALDQSNGTLAWSSGSIALVQCQKDLADPNTITDCTPQCCHDVDPSKVQRCSTNSNAFKQCQSMSMNPKIIYDYSDLPCLADTIEAHDGRINAVGGGS